MSDTEGMMTLTVGDLAPLVENICFKHNEPLMVWGTFGIGKTDVIAQTCEKNNVFLCTVLTSQYESVDFRGLPDRDGDNTIWLRASTIPFVGNDAFPDDRTIMLFLDEITSVTPSVAAILYQLVHERRVGEHVLKPNVVICAAGNLSSDKGIVNRLPMPLNNRFTHCHIIPDVDAWCARAQKDSKPPVGLAFLQFRKKLLHNYDPKDASSPKAVATPRSWYKALNYYADDTMPENIKRVAMAGAVGEGPMTEFYAFVTVWQKVQNLVPRILKDPDGVEVPDEDSLKYAVAVCVSGEMNEKTVEPLHTYLMRLDPTFTVLAWTLACNRDKNLFKTGSFVEYAKKFKAVFQD